MTPSRRAWTPLFLNADPHNTGKISPEMVASRMAFLSSSSVGSVPPKYFYAEVPFKMNYLGGYHEMGAFFEKVSQLKRIVSIDEIDATTERYSGDAEPMLKLNVEARTFRFLPPEERPVEEKNKKGAKRRRR